MIDGVPLIFLMYALFSTILGFWVNIKGYNMLYILDLKTEI